MPPLQIPDEWAHLMRAYGVSQGSCIAPVGTRIPEQFFRFNDEYGGQIEQRRKVTPAEELRLLEGSLDEGRTEVLLNPAANLYSCVPYLPISAAIRVARLVHLSAAAIMYLCRAVNLGMYVFFTWLALRLLPDFHVLLFSLALTPMALHQAASASADGLTISSSFLLCAYILRLTRGEGAGVVQRGEHATLAALFALNALCKFNLWIVLMALLIPVARFGSKRKRWLWFAGDVAVSCGAAALWQGLNWHNTLFYADHLRSLEISLSGNLSFVVQHPGLYVRAVQNTLTVDGALLARQFIGHLGWLTITLPAWVIAGYWGLLAVVSLTQTSHALLSPRQRWLLLLVVLESGCSLFVLLWMNSTTAGYLSGSILYGTGMVGGLQGRYFIPLSFPALLLFSNTRLRLNPRWALAAAACCACSASFAAYGAIWLAFYAPRA